MNESIESVIINQLYDEAGLNSDEQTQNNRPTIPENINASNLSEHIVCVTIDY